MRPKGEGVVIVYGVERGGTKMSNLFLTFDKEVLPDQVWCGWNTSKSTNMYGTQGDVKNVPYMAMDVLNVYCKAEKTVCARCGMTTILTFVERTIHGAYIAITPTIPH